MIRLVGAELDRLLGRRLTVVLLIAVLAAVGLFQIGLSQAVRPPSAEAVAAARQGFERDHRDWQANHETYEQQCRDQGGTDCTIPEPTEEDYGLAPAPYAQITGTGVLLSVVLTMLASYLLAASLIGAEYTSGALGNWLTFVPQRGRVFASKLVALGIGSAVLGVVSGALMVGVAAIVAAAFGQPLNGLGGVAAMAARGTALAVFAAVLGFCIAMLTRHTVGALGVLLGYLLLVLGTYVLGYFLPVVTWVRRWAIETNMQAFLYYGRDYTILNRVVSSDGVGVLPDQRFLSFGASSVYWAVLLVTLVAATLLVFRRRDVT